MTDEQIIELARQVGIKRRTDKFFSEYCDGIYDDDLKAFAKLVAQHEREACAKEADKRLYDYTMLLSNPPQNGAAWSIANAIRARGQRTPEGGEA